MASSIIGAIINAILRWIEGPMTDDALAAALDKQEAAGPERLDWRNSIVDLMKLTGQDPSLLARERLARELGYLGRLDGSAAMNNWLHAAVMARLKASRG